MAALMVLGEEGLALTEYEELGSMLMFRDESNQISQSTNRSFPTVLPVERLESGERTFSAPKAESAKSAES